MVRYFLQVHHLCFRSRERRRVRGVGSGLAVNVAWPELYEVVLLLLFLFFLFVVCRKVLREVKKVRMAARIAGGNHPTIPAIHYETPRLPETPEPAKRMKPKKRQQEKPAAEELPVEKEQALEGYTFYVQLDSMEED